MRISVLIDNKALPGFNSEWGLSFHVTTEFGQYLIDAGASSRFSRNARQLGIDLNAVDDMFLSHAHYDHGGGIKAFAARNAHAPLHIAEPARENCYSRHTIMRAYIGLRRGTLLRYADRIAHESTDSIRISGEYGEPTVIPHFFDPDRGTSSMFVKENGHLVPDTFRHEQTVVFRTPKGLVVFSPCSHLGLPAIIREVNEVFQGERIYALLGGFHMFKASEELIYSTAWELRSLGIGRIYAGHCTGDTAIKIFGEVFDGRVTELAAGMVIDI